MRHESITWANNLAKLYPDIKDKEYVSNLIENYENSTNVLMTPASLVQEMSKRQKTVITPEDLKPAALPNLAMTDVQWQLFIAILAQLPVVSPVPINEQTTAEAAINNIDGNSMQSTEWTQRNLDLTR